MRTILTLILIAAAAWGQLTQSYMVGQHQYFGGVAQSLTLNASGDLASACGPVRVSDRGASKSLNTVAWRFGSITKSNGPSTLTVSLQDMALTGTPTVVPDETQDQSYTIANADASFASNQYYTATLSTNRTVSHGDRFCVVWEIGNFGAGDSVAFNMVTQSFNQASTQVKKRSGGTYSTQSMAPNVVFGFTDGTIGTFESSVIFTAVASTGNVGSGTNPDEYGMAFSFDAATKIDAIWANVYLAGTSSDIVLTLVEGSTVRQTCTIDAQTVASTNNFPIYCTFAPYTIPANTTFYVAARPTTTNTVTFPYLDLAAAAQRILTPYGTNWSSNTRNCTDDPCTASWGTASTTLQYPFGVRVVETGSASTGASSYAIVQ